MSLLTQWGRPLTRSLMAAALTQDTLLVICDLWESIGPGPETLLLRADGSIASRRSGLVGPWRLLSDTSLAIRSRQCELRSQRGEVFSSFQPDSTGRSSIGWHVRKSGG